MQVRFRSRLVLPFALALGFSALVTSQAHAQVNGYSVKSVITKNYTGGTSSSGSFGSGYISIPGYVGNTASLVNKTTYLGQVVGSAVAMGSNNGSGGGISSQSSSTQIGTTSVEAIIKIHNPVGHPGVAFYTVGHYGRNYGKLAGSNGATISYNMLGIHGALADAVIGPVPSVWPPVYSIKDPGYVEGPEQTFNSPCYYDSNGDYVFRAYFSCGLSNTVTGAPSGNPNLIGGGVYDANLHAIAYLKKIEGETWINGHPEMFDGLFTQYNNGVGTYNAPQ